MELKKESLGELLVPLIKDITFVFWHGWTTKGKTTYKSDFHSSLIAQEIGELKIKSGEISAKVKTLGMCVEENKKIFSSLNLRFDPIEYDGKEYITIIYGTTEEENADFCDMMSEIFAENASGNIILSFIILAL